MRFRIPPAERGQGGCFIFHWSSGARRPAVAGCSAVGAQLPFFAEPTKGTLFVCRWRAKDVWIGLWPRGFLAAAPWGHVALPLTWVERGDSVVGLTYHSEGSLDVGVFVEHGHEGLGDAGGVVVLDDVAAVDDAVDALFKEGGGAFENGAVVDFAAAADEDGDAACGFDDLVVEGDVVGGVGFDDVGAELDGLADEVDDFVGFAVDHVSARDIVGSEDEGFDHHGHAVGVALDFEAHDVVDALVGDVGGAGDLKEVDADAGGVELDGLEGGVFDHGGEAGFGKGFAVDVGGVGAEDEGGLLPAGMGLKVSGLADGELDRIGAGVDEGVDDLGHRFDAFEEAGLVEESVIDGDVEAAAGLGVEEAVEAGGFHEGIVCLQMARI
jgi:hypothetical protein